MTALDRLESVLSRGSKLAPRVTVSGVVTEIATSHFRVAGLSRFVRMGEIVRLGADIRAGEVPQFTVPARAWQAAESTGDWTLVGCTVAPGFAFDGFELAPADFSPRK